MTNELILLAAWPAFDVTALRGLVGLGFDDHQTMLVDEKLCKGHMLVGVEIEKERNSEYRKHAKAMRQRTLLFTN